MSTLICNNRFAIPLIDIDECIGLSLNKINKNFQDLRDECCLTFSELNLIQSDFNTVSGNFISLSAFEYINLYPKVWINFDGTTATPSVCSVYAISGIPTVAKIDKHSTGVYGLSFTNSFSNDSYCLIGTTKQISATPCFVQAVSTTPFTPTSASINIMTLSGTFVDSDYVSIAIYSL